MSLDLNNPDAWPAYRPLLHGLAQLWEPPPEPATPSTTPAPSTTTPTTATVAAGSGPPEGLAATPDIVTLTARVDDLCARLRRLEQAHNTTPPAPPLPSAPKPPKPPYVGVPQATVDGRWNAWIDVPTRDPRYGGLPPSVAQDQFARHNGLSIREFRRWFSAHRTHAPGSPQDLKYRLRVREALERLPEPCITD
jgi:hypothetical protein